jgi:LacI family transcriptional regulator
MGARMTVKEIAELAGVSIGTVDRVLHGRGRVSAETKSRIQTIVERSGFTPNPVARRLKRTKEYRFMALLPTSTEDSGYWGQAAAGIAGAADEIASFGVRTIVHEFDRYDPASFHEAAEAALAGESDGILLAPVMPEEARKFVARLDAIPYAFFDADLPGTSPLCTIGQDSFRGGYLAGRLATLFAAGGAASFGPFAVLAAHAEDFHIRTRRDGFLAYAAENGFRAIVKDDVDLEHAAAAWNTLQDLLEETPELAGVFVTSASSHRIAEAARTLREQRRFVIVGYDLVSENERLLRSGSIDAIISQRPETQARRGLLDLYRSIVVGIPVEKRVEVPIDLYIKENLPSPIVKDAVADPDRGSKNRGPANFGPTDIGLTDINPKGA